MAGNERDAFVFTGEQVGIAVFRFGQDFQVGVIADQLCRKIGVARMRSQESVIETTRQQRMRVSMKLNASVFRLSAYSGARGCAVLIA